MSVVTNNTATYHYPPQASLSLQVKSKNTLQKKINFIHSTAEHIWSYLGKVTSLVKSILSAISASPVILALRGSEYISKIKNVTSQMKFLSIIGLTFSVINVIQTALKLFKSISIKDYVGVVLTSLSIAQLLGGIFDSVTTFVNAILSAAAVPLQILSSVAVPLGFALSGLGIILRTMQIARGAHLFKQIKNELINDEKFKDKNVLINFLQKKLGIDKELEFERAHPEDIKNLERLKEKNKAVLLRSAPAGVVKELNELLTMVENIDNENLPPEALEDISNRLEHIQHLLKKKMKMDVIALLANFISLVAVILLTVGSFGVAPFILLAVAGAIQLSLVLAQDYKPKAPASEQKQALAV